MLFKKKNNSGESGGVGVRGGGDVQKAVHHPGLTLWMLFAQIPDPRCAEGNQNPNKSWCGELQPNLTSEPQVCGKNPSV